MESTFRMNMHIVKQVLEWTGTTGEDLMDLTDWDGRAYQSFAMICGIMHRPHEYYMDINSIAQYFRLPVVEIKKAIAKHDVCAYSMTQYRIICAHVMAGVCNKIDELKKNDVQATN